MFARHAGGVVLALVICLMAGLISTLPATRASAAPGPTVSCTNDISTDIVSRKRCINGQVMQTRGRMQRSAKPPAGVSVDQNCFKAADKSQPTVSRFACGGNAVSVQAERIAQARFLQSLSDPSAPADRVSKDLQWEVRGQRITATGATGGGRIDALQYDPDGPATQPVTIWELKGTWSSENPATQVAEYQRYLQTKLGWTVSLGTLHYRDAFEVDLTSCDPLPDSVVPAEKIYRKYEVADDPVCGPA